MNKNICFTLSYNLTSETEKAVDRLYSQNNREDFVHHIVDLGFPLEEDVIPKDINQAIKNNSERLKNIALKYGSSLLQVKNIGVSQNWQAIYQYVNPDDSDILIGVDPDEQTLTSGWVKAMGKIMRNSDEIGLCSLMMTDHEPIMGQFNYITDTINGERIYILNGLLNWALIGINCKFLNKLGYIPYPEIAPKYGWIESALCPLLEEHKYSWCMMPDYRVMHTECSKLYRAWKNDIIFRINEVGQPDFVEWLEINRKNYE